MVCPFCYNSVLCRNHKALIFRRVPVEQFHPAALCQQFFLWLLLLPAAVQQLFHVGIGRHLLRAEGTALPSAVGIQAQRTGIARPTFTDLPIMFKDGNPKPIPGYKARMDAARTMYHELSPETAEFIDFMQDNELFDVESRPGKMSGGYMTSLPSYKAPFIFANWNNTCLLYTSPSPRD